LNCLVVANVLSEATRPEPDSRVVRWLRENERGLVVNPIVLGEIRFGILLLRRSRRRRELERWFEEGIQRLRCVDWDAETALHCSELLAGLRRRGRAMPVKDSLIAASALRHGLPLATLDRGDFDEADVAVIDPRA
jgi:predicted nucleic acid-binding protein